MRLHRAAKAPDWEKIPAAQRNSFQRLAAQSSGVLTLANLITLLGLLTVLYGGLAVYHGHYWTGLIFIMVGRLADLLDGWVADKTGTKNAVGEFFDAASDKIATLALLGLFLFAHVAPWWILGLMVLPHIIIGIVSGDSWARRRRMHPSRTGKYTMAAVWIILGGFVLLQALQKTHGPAMIILDILALMVAGIGLYAAAGYVRVWAKLGAL